MLELQRYVSAWRYYNWVVLAPGKIKGRKKGVILYSKLTQPTHIYLIAHKTGVNIYLTDSVYYINAHNDENPPNQY